MPYWLSLNQQNIICVSRSQAVSVDHKLFQWIASCFSGSQVFRFSSTTLANSEPYNNIKHLWWSFSLENWCFRVFLFPLKYVFKTTAFHEFILWSFSLENWCFRVFLFPLKYVFKTTALHEFILYEHPWTWTYKSGNKAINSYYVT